MKTGNERAGVAVRDVLCLPAGHLGRGDMGRGLCNHTLTNTCGCKFYVIPRWEAFRNVARFQTPLLLFRAGVCRLTPYHLTK